MNHDARDSAAPLEEIRGHLASRLRSRDSEIELAIYVRLQEAVPDPIADNDPVYQAGVRAAITAVVAYGLESIERGPGWSGPIPQAAAAQARLAARAGVSLGTVLRRYVAGHGELGEFVMKEAHQSGVSNNGPALHHIRRTQEALLEHLTGAIEHEYNDEQNLIASSPERRREEIVQKLLSGESDPGALAELDYEVHASWHVGVIATGAGAAEVLQRLKEHFGRRLLPVSLGGRVLAWVSGHEMLATAEIERLSTSGRLRSALAVGESGKGIDGLRLTHDQANAALGIALRTPERFARYADDRLLAAVLQNDTLARSLRQKYLTPLRSQRDGGATLRRTLRTYINLECNATSAAEVLNVGRRTVKSRVCVAERLIGCALHECSAELDVALRLEELDGPGATDVAPLASDARNTE